MAFAILYKKFKKNIFSKHILNYYMGLIQGRSATLIKVLDGWDELVFKAFCPSVEEAHQRSIVTLVERKSDYAVKSKVHRKTADQVRAAIVKWLQPLAWRVKTITYDNGKEFAEHKFIDTILGSTAYFADPFASWLRGSNENYNGLVRQHIPKKRRLSNVTYEGLKMIEERLNHRLRKRLGFKTPHQMFHGSLQRVALHTWIHEDLIICNLT